MDLRVTLPRLIRTAAALMGMGLLAILLAAAGPDASNQSVPKGPYLGQKAPGTTPQVFAPGFVSTAAHEFSCSFTPDGMEFYFARRDPKLNTTVVMVTRCVGRTWTEPEVAPFVGRDWMSFEPRITPDGRRLYFNSDRPVPGQSEGGPPSMNIWYVERDNGRWGELQAPGAPLNPNKAMYVSVTLDGTIYTTDVSGGPGQEAIAVSRLIEGRYQKLERLGLPFNTGAQDMYPCVAPDESYLVFASRRPGPSGAEGLFVSFRTPERTWTEPRPINLGMQAGMPAVSPDGKYLFFTAGERGKSDIYWVDAEVFKALRPAGPDAFGLLIQRSEVRILSDTPSIFP